MLKYKSFQKTVLSTVFFYALLINPSCGTVNSENESSLETKVVSKYIVDFSINTKCYINNYYKSAQPIFFPLLSLNKDGSLVDNYVQNNSEKMGYVLFSSTTNFYTSTKKVADEFAKKYKFNHEPLIYNLPLDDKSYYFIRFYYYMNSDSLDHNSLYFKSSIEYFDPKGESKSPKNVWVGEGYFGFDKSIREKTSLNAAIIKVFNHAFNNYTLKGKFNLLDM